MKLGIDATGDKMYWKAVIEDNQEGAEVWYRDGSKGEDGKVGAGWANRKEEGSDSLGRIATVWDGEVRGLRGALEMASS